MSPSFRRNLVFYSALAVVIALVLIFPRVEAFVALAAREIRYLWWLILIAAFGLYLAFFVGRKKKD
jgi:hypothetical protein